MIRHPSELFLKYCMTLPRQEAAHDGWIAMYTEHLGFPKPDFTYLMWLRAEFTRNIPANFQPTNKYHKESVQFLKTEQIYGLHHPDATVMACFNLLISPRPRQLVEDLLLGRLEPKEVAKKVNARLSEYFTTEVIEVYAHYFWNCGLLKVDDWATLLKEVDYRREHTMAILQVGPAMALHKHGFQQHIDSKAVLQEMQETIYFDFRDWKSQARSPLRTKALSTLARSAVLIDERLAEADSALKESLKAFEQFRMKQAEHAVKGMEQIAPLGNYTGSGAKLLEAPEKPQEGPPR